jgi:hypothetical protein
MRRWFILLLLALSVFSGCGWKHRVKNLSDTEFQHYYALKPFMTEDLQKGFLKLKTEEQRNKYLQDHKLWDMFYQYSQEERTAIVNGEVAVGWTKDRVLMAWGAPYDKRSLAGRHATRSELLVYRFESDADGTIRVWEPGSKTAYKAVRQFTKRVTLDDDKVMAIEDVDGWE